MRLIGLNAGAFMATAFIAGTGLARTGQAAVHCTPSGAAGVSVCKIDPALHPDALCNDGTAPVFFYRPGSGTGASKWLIWLQGGDGWCVDTASCTLKAVNPKNARQFTSNGVHSVSPEGLLSPDPAVNPGLSNANNVFVHYCSSDMWTGAYHASAPFDPTDPTTWSFEGRNNAIAAVASLNEMSVGLSAATQILLGGDSAGGMGMAMVANDLIPLLPRTAQVGVILDAGFTIDIGAYDPTTTAPYVSAATPTAFEQIWWNGLSLWHGHGDSVCDAQAVTSQDHVRCATTSSVVDGGYIQAPVFVAQSQLDSPQISLLLCPDQYGDCNVSNQPTSTKGKYAAYFGQQMLTALQGAVSMPYTVFAPDQYMHVVLAKDSTFTVAYPFPNGSMSPQAALYDWVAQMSATQLHVSRTPGVAKAAH